jgi:hypothetical protein
VTHMQSGEAALCELSSSVEMIGALTRTMFGPVDCTGCLRRALAEAEARVRMLRDLLAMAEGLS